MGLTMDENGLDFILSSIRELRRAEEEFIQEDEKERCLKYCLLHLSSGIELVLKSRLFKSHWTYIFSDMNKASKKSLKMGSFKSTDSNQAIERLEKLCEIELSKIDKEVLKDLRDLRNKFEHFKSDEEMASIESKVNKALSFIIKFIQENHSTLYSEVYLDTNNNYNNFSFTHKENIILDQIIKETKELKKHYDDALSIAKIKAKAESQNWELFICPECKEKLLKCEDGISKCYLCNNPRSGEETADDYIYSVIGIVEYEEVTQGGEYPLYRCPNCGDKALVRNQEKNYQCFSCGECYIESDLEHCQDCWELTYRDEECFQVLCDNCLEYRKERIEKW